MSAETTYFERKDGSVKRARGAAQEVALRFAGAKQLDAEEGKKRYEEQLEKLSKTADHKRGSSAGVEKSDEGDQTVVDDGSETASAPVVPGPGPAPRGGRK